MRLGTTKGLKRTSILSRVIVKLTFKWARTEDSREVLIEGRTIRVLRITYLRASKNKELKREILYLTSHICIVATDGSTSGYHVSISKGR
jgi:hypothetical protein